MSHSTAAMQLAERTQRAVLRYLSMLQALPFDTFVDQLPSLRDLRLRYKVPPEYALALLRPLLRQMLPEWKVDDAEIVEDGSAEAGAAMETDGAATPHESARPFATSVCVCVASSCRAA